MSGLLEVERAAYPEDAESARLLLEKTITTYLNVIPKNSGELGQTAVSGVLTAGLGPAQGALSLAMQEILSRVPDGITLIARRAAEMVLESIAKLRTAVGEDQQKQVEDQAVKWLKDIQDQKDTVASLLNRLYETPRIAEETAGIIGSAPQDAAAAAYNQATEALEKLLDGSKKTRLTLGTVMRVMAFAKNSPDGNTSLGHPGSLRLLRGYFRVCRVLWRRLPGLVSDWRNRLVGSRERHPDGRAPLPCPASGKTCCYMIAFTG